MNLPLKQSGFKRRLNTIVFGMAIVGTATIGTDAVCSPLAQPAPIQKNAPVSSIQWGPNLPDVVLGAGLSIHPNGISKVGGVCLDIGEVKHSFDGASFSLLDYRKSYETIKKLHINAWAEIHTLFGNGANFSFDFSNYEAVSGNHLHFEVDAERHYTAFAPTVELSAKAKTYVNTPLDFEAKCGNYAVTQITYYRKVAVVFDVALNSQVSQQKIDVAMAGAYGIFKGGASLNQASSSLNNIGQTTVTISIKGQQAGQLLAAGTAEDLTAIKDAVTKIVSTWGEVPPDPNDAGNIESVFVTPYTAIFDAVKVTPQAAPAQDDLLDAVISYLQLEKARRRLIELQAPNRVFNEQLKTYMFGTDNAATGEHNLGTGKYDEVTRKRDLVYNYMKARDKGETAKFPKQSFNFDDPDAIRWRLLEAFRVKGGGTWVTIEVYSLQPLSMSIPEVPETTPGFLTWVSGLTKDKNGFLLDVGPQLTPAESLEKNLDPKTGIPHRYVTLKGQNLEGPTSVANITVILKDVNRQELFTALDLQTGQPMPQIIIPTGELKIMY